ncbi:MAG: hypothetical protein V7679_14365 [Parasphingorhabdus sp.]
MRIIAIGLLGLLFAEPISAEEISEAYVFQCDFMLMTSQHPQRFSAPSPVEIQFSRNNDGIDNIHVIDTGGIIYPGGNLKAVKTEDAIRIETVEIPAERPGVWSASIVKDQYKFRLATPDMPDAVSFGLSKESKNPEGEHIVIWNAKHQPEGMPKPLKGTGVGYCRPKSQNEVES